jgi:hypothetical protein
MAALGKCPHMAARCPHLQQSCSDPSSIQCHYITTATSAAVRLLDRFSTLRDQPMSPGLAKQFVAARLLVESLE